MYNPLFDVHSVTVVAVNVPPYYGLATLTTPNGTDTPDVEYLAFDLRQGRVPQTALDAGMTPDSRLRLSDIEVPAPKVGDRLYFTGDLCTATAVNTAGLELPCLRMFGRWCQEETWHQQLSNLPEFRITRLNSGRETIMTFNNVLEIQGRLAEQRLEPRLDWQWQTRPGRGQRSYTGVMGEDVNRDWENCPAPI